MLIEDADRLTEKAGNALLKAVEEPSPRTVFLLCTPVDPPRRHLGDDPLPVPGGHRCARRSAESIAAMLVRRDGVDARHWRPGPPPPRRGTSAGPAGWPATRRPGRRREAVLAVPRRLTGIGACFDAAAALIAATEAEAAANVSDVDAKERAELEIALGAGGTGRGAAGALRGAAGALKELERRQKSRATRAQRDALDRALVDLAGFYRDVLAAPARAPASPPVHVDAVADAAGRGAASGRPESALRRLEAVLACREAIEANVKPRDRRRSDDGHPLARLTRPPPLPTLGHAPRLVDRGRMPVS